MATRTSTGKSKRPESGTPAAALLDHASLLQALKTLLQPLATLSVARGMSFAVVEEMLKKAFVDAARITHSNAAHRVVSRISTATGLNRREVSRLLKSTTRRAPIRRSPATEVFTRWIAEPSLKNAQGEPLPLPRQGPSSSFEKLARSVNRDVHPRSLLEELLRLGLVRLEGETVHVVRDSFVPKQDVGRMLGFLGHNVGDHFRAAVANVLADSPSHLEQAVFADELSQESLDHLRDVMRAQWKGLLEATVPLLHKLIAADRSASRDRGQRVRVGIYMFSEPMAAPLTGGPDVKRRPRSQKASLKKGT
ncbi:MAG TPA: DUF6502 family protein [Burkholderiales bacterium]|nr:DUF6502 family protein [Burkholderiales bacterium]